jgi:hypothetical protein
MTSRRRRWLAMPPVALVVAGCAGRAATDPVLGNAGSDPPPLRVAVTATADVDGLAELVRSELEHALAVEPWLAVTAAPSTAVHIEVEVSAEVDERTYSCSLTVQVGGEEDYLKVLGGGSSVPFDRPDVVARDCVRDAVAALLAEDLLPELAARAGRPR